MPKYKLVNGFLDVRENYYMYFKNNIVWNNSLNKEWWMNTISEYVSLAQ